MLGVSGTQSILGYQGDITDPVTSQVDMGTRWYAPSRAGSPPGIGVRRMGDPMSLNQYAYGAMNPVTMTDPTGMRPYCDDCSNGTNKHLAHDYSSNQDAYGPGSAYWYSFQPAPPPPAPIIEYSPRPFTSPEQRNGDIDRYHKWVDHNPNIRVDRTGPSWDVSARRCGHGCREPRRHSFNSIGRWLLEHRWQLMALAIVGACLVGTAGFESLLAWRSEEESSCGDQELEITVNEFRADDGPSLSRWANNTAFNATPPCPVPPLDTGTIFDRMSGVLCLLESLCGRSTGR